MEGLVLRDRDKGRGFIDLGYLVKHDIVKALINNS